MRRLRIFSLYKLAGSWFGIMPEIIMFIDWSKILLMVFYSLEIKLFNFNIGKPVEYDGGGGGGADGFEVSFII